MNPKKYFVAGEKLLAFNAKCCTSTMVREIIRSYYPDIEAIITQADYPEGKTADNTQHHRWVPARINPDRPVVQIVRDPVDRFASAMAQLHLTDVDGVINELRSEAGAITFNNRLLAANVHFLPQARFDGDISYFRHDNADAAAAALGLNVPLPVMNESKTKPSISEAQAALIKEWYADDQALWDSITAA